MIVHFAQRLEAAVPRSSCLYYTGVRFSRKVRTILWRSYREVTIERLPKGNKCVVWGFFGGSV